MDESTFTFRVDQRLKSRFAEVARSRDRTGAQLLRDFMRGVVSQQSQEAEHDTWFRREVAAALAEADDPATGWISSEQLERDSARWRKRVQAHAADKP